MSADAKQARLPVTPEEYLIRKGGAYYRPNAAGYTNNVDEAGRYTLAEAIRHSHPNGPDGPRDGIDYMPAPARQSHSLPGDVGIDREAAKEVATRISEEMFSHPDDLLERDIAYGAAFAGIVEATRKLGDVGMREALEGLSLAADEINGDIDLQVNGDHSEEVDVNGEYYVTLSAAKVNALNKAICVAQRLLKKVPARPASPTGEKILTLAKRKYPFQPTIGAVLRSHMPTGTTGHDWDAKEAFGQAIAILDLIPDLAALTPSALSDLQRLGQEYDGEWQPRIGDEVRASESFLSRYGEWRDVPLYVAGICKDRGTPGLNVSVSEKWPVDLHSDGYTDGFYIGRDDCPDDLVPHAVPSALSGDAGEVE